jgi:nitroimidazol reductase NimA-like FMN-containing flavoprotein (pyridoxamine 5'-phosphate oxidase superfamily)
VGALPDEVEEILNQALVGEFTVLGAGGRPITHPMIPLYDGEKVYVHSSVLFSKKLGHIRRNPRVSLAVTDQGATHGDRMAHRVSIQGDAALIEEDPHTTWERILPLWIAKEPVVKAFYAKRVAMPMFWERTLIEVTPRRALLWEDGRTDRPPREFEVAGVS